MTTLPEGYVPLSAIDRAEIADLCETAALNGDITSDYVAISIRAEEYRRERDYWKQRAEAAERRPEIRCPRCGQKHDPDRWCEPCASCGSPDVFLVSAAEGYACRGCGASDEDE